ncbi:hypothetical protein C7N43_26830 [Sphingobacteriales bacterium UPWRP_1]|nr:hypothetical protein BVG80_14870 [Sphingobacteriales bacterium TSM_CSM]PSJ73901.1 hypothetical protein C7N43_26830 [Sphingobacteriales bacterium UPWRP_1]
MKQSFWLLLFGILLLVLGALSRPAAAQELTFSRPQKVAGKISDYEIIGQTDAGLLVHQWGERYHVIDAYNNKDMSLKWSKELFLPDKKAKVLSVVGYKNELIIFYAVKRKRTTYVYVRKVNADLQQIMPEVVADTIQRNFGSYGFSYQVSVSKNKNFLSLQRINNDFNGVNSVHCVVLNRNLELLGSKNIPIENKLLNEDNFISNSGEVFLLDSQTKRTFSTNAPQFEAFKLLRYNFASDKLSTALIEEVAYLLSDIQFEVDDRNGRIVAGGFYNEKQSGDVSGYFYLFIDLATGQVSEKVFTPFSAEILKRVSSNTLIRSKDQIANLRMREVITRQDGGALLIGELFYTVQQQMPRATFDNFYARQQGTSFYYYDILLLCLNPDGSLYWGNVVQKRQISDDDGGYYSSFGLVNNRSNLSLIFNEDISTTTNLSNYTLDVSGKYTMSSLLRAKDYNLMVAPRYCKQVAPDVVVLPAFNERNDFVLLRIDFSHDTQTGNR